MAVFPTLETERLILRRIELSDAPLVYEYMQDREIAFNTKLIPYPYPEGGAEEWIKRTHEAAERGNDFSFARARPASSEPGNSRTTLRNSRMAAVLSPI